MTSNEKVTQAVKEALSDYEPQFDASGWNEMEKMLDGSPKAPSFKWTFSLNTVVGTTMLAGGLLAAYLIAGSSKMDATANRKNENTSPKQTIQQSFVQQPVVTLPITEEQAALNEVIAENPVVGEALKRVEDAEHAAKVKTRKSVAKNKGQEVNPAETDKGLNEYDFMKAQESMRMNKVATFGDQITTHGFVNNTNEDEALKLKAQSKIENADEVLSAVKKDSTISTKIIGSGEKDKKQSKRKKNKSPQTETAPQNTSNQKGDSLKVN